MMTGIRTQSNERRYDGLFRQPLIFLYTELELMKINENNNCQITYAYNFSVLFMRITYILCHKEI